MLYDERCKDLTGFAFAMLDSLATPGATGLMSNSVDDWANGNAVVCNGIPGLTKEQRDLCYANPDVTVAALKGIQMAISECQHQFAWHRWNCSTLTPSSRTQKNSIMLQRGELLK
ncbi:hypothetical protein PV325_001041 [Microctonus aethiopoides]|nr:hypothetical protein PV325_001041 [Microctonus aethiopoides]